MKLRLPGASARARTIIVSGTLFGSMITGGWLLQRGSRTGMFTAYEGQRLFDNVLRHVENDYVDSVNDSLLYRKSLEGMLYDRLPIFIDIGDTPSGDPIMDGNAFRLTAAGGAGLARAVERLRSLEPAQLAAVQGAARAYAESYLRAPTPDAVRDMADAMLRA